MKRNQQGRNNNRWKHGLHGTRVYRSWYNMKRRCLDPNNTSYADYGGRGIKLCDRWHDFRNFFKDMGHPPEGTELDRIDNGGNYEPANCRWATRKTQANNTRTNRWITFNGRTQTLAEWAQEVGLASSALHYRLNHMSIDRAMNPGNQQRRYISFNNQTKTLKEWAQEAGLESSTLHYRLKKMSMAEALTKPVQATQGFNGT